MFLFLVSLEGSLGQLYFSLSFDFKELCSPFLHHLAYYQSCLFAHQTVPHPTSLYFSCPIRNPQESLGQSCYQLPFIVSLVLRLPEQLSRDKVNISFHCLKAPVRTSEFSTDQSLFGCDFRFSTSTPHPMFQADEVLPVLCSTFIFNGPRPFPTVPTVWNVLMPTYHLPGSSPLSFKVTLGAFSPHQSVTYC